MIPSSQVLCGWSLLPLWPGLTPSSLLCSARSGRGQGHRRRPGMGPLPSQASLPPGSSRMRQARGCPGSRQALSYRGQGAQPLCCAPVCFLKAHPPPLSRSGASLVTQPSLIQAPGPPLVLAKCAVAWPSVLCNLRLPPTNCPPHPHTLSSPPTATHLGSKGFKNRPGLPPHHQP